MASFIKTTVTSSFLTLSIAATAASPISITFDSNGSTADGIEYANYLVKCSNNKKLPLTAWNKRKKWCLGEASQESCFRKQIKAAKRACR